MFKRLRETFLASVLMLPAIPLVAADYIDNSSPEKLIHTSFKALLADLDAYRAAYRKNISGLLKVIETQFLPHVDMTFTARQVLGLHWRDASPEQRKRFTAALSRSLLTIYGKAPIEFTSDQMRVLPFKADPAAKSAEVRTAVRTRSGLNVSVSYQLRKEDGEDWKVWDVAIDGVRYVKVFHDDFEAEIGRKGLDALLARLENEQL
jgi:phospholipid transport system substrate-binding protein